MAKKTKETSRIDRQGIFDLYWARGLTPAQIGEVYKCSKDVIIYRMRSMGIPFRSRSEACAKMCVSRKRKPTNSPLKSELTCKECGAFWVHVTRSTRALCPYCGAGKDARIRPFIANSASKKRKQSFIEWCSDSEKRKKSAAKSRRLLRKRVFFRISGEISHSCTRCGCRDSRFLEVNHKNGGGAKETKNGKWSMQFYHSIASGKRRVDDLEILCRPCNAIHFLEMLIEMEEHS